MIPGRTRSLLDQAVEQQGLCGAALGVVDAAGQRETYGLGRAAREPEPHPLSEGTWWDLASLTKPLFTAREVLRGVEDGLLDLGDPLTAHLPDLAWMQETPLKARTLRQLLTHTAGLPAWAPLYTWGDAATIRTRLLQEPWPVKEPGRSSTATWGTCSSGRCWSGCAGCPCASSGWTGADLHARPGVQRRHRALPMARPYAARRDARRERLGAGRRGGSRGAIRHARRGARTSRGAARRLALPAAQVAATRPHTAGRSLAFVTAQPGWSGGSLCGERAFGHTGFTGTGLWVEPERDLAWVLLTNRVHPSRHGTLDIQALRRAVGNTLLAARA